MTFEVHKKGITSRGRKSHDALSRVRRTGLTHHTNALDSLRGVSVLSRTKPEAASL